MHEFTGLGHIQLNLDHNPGPLVVIDDDLDILRLLCLQDIPSVLKNNDSAHNVALRHQLEDLQRNANMMG